MGSKFSSVIIEIINEFLQVGNQSVYLRDRSYELGVIGSTGAVLKWLIMRLPVILVYYGLLGSIYCTGRFLLTNRLSRAITYGVHYAATGVTQRTRDVAVYAGGQMQQFGRVVIYPMMMAVAAMTRYLGNAQGVTAFAIILAVQFAIFFGLLVGYADTPVEQARPVGWLEQILGPIIPVPENFPRNFP